MNNPLLPKDSPSLQRNGQIYQQNKKDAHQSNTYQPYVPHQEDHANIGDLMKSFVYGAVDGTNNTLIVILSGYSSGTSANVILAMCLSICLGDSIVMALGDYLSARAQIEYIKSEEAREYHQVDNLLDDERKEIVQIYTQKYYDNKDAERLAELYSTSRKAFVDIMMLEELGLVVVNPALAVKCGIATFTSFLIFGVLPVLPYIITVAISKQSIHPWIYSVCIGTIELFGLGLIKASIIGSRKMRSGLQVLIVGGLATAVGYGIGFAFPNTK